MNIDKAKSIGILGRQPSIGLAELESLYGADNLQPFGEHALTGLEASSIVFSRLGGSLKFGKVLTILPTIKWSDIERYLTEQVVTHAKYLPDGKLTLGLSSYGLKVQISDINRTALSLKKIIKSSGRPVRVVPNKTSELNSAQVLHNRLTGPLGWELLLVSDGRQTILAQTTSAQDIEAYARRDQNRPMRDPQVGMLPPKLAQIIINMAKAQPGQQLLDPFCGTGVVLQEAALLGIKVYGTDLEERMVNYTKQNLDWLNETHEVNVEPFLEVADATNHKWRHHIDLIASETYLGRPFTALPSSDILNSTVHDTNLILTKFLKNLRTQLKGNVRLSLALPAWNVNQGFTHLPLLDQLTDMGYNRVQFVHATNKDLVYYRPGQIVARELVVLETR